VKPVRTVLIVEDDEAMRNLLDDQLREARYEVVAAASAAEALERLGQSQVDVLVTDHMMPGMKGRELLTEVRARDPDLPVVIITGFGSIEGAVDAMRGGACHYVTKPFRVDELLSTIEGALRERALWRENAIERALVLGTGARIGVGDLPPVVRLRSAGAIQAERPLSLADVEREHILRTLRASEGNRATAARLLGVDRKTLYRKLKQYRIRRRSLAELERSDS